jgi:hypothetical protein
VRDEAERQIWPDDNLASLPIVNPGFPRFGAPAARNIHAYWLARRAPAGETIRDPRQPIHKTPVPGRNDPCPCGSGKKGVATSAGAGSSAMRNIRTISTGWAELEVGSMFGAYLQPEQMTAKQRRQWESWHRDRLLAEDDTPWLTVGRALDELADLSENAQPNQRQQITEIESFLKSLSN